jgi:hypothetical protein
MCFRERFEHAAADPTYDIEQLPDIILSYDAMCSYQVHLADRFGLYIPELASLVARIRKAIPALHVNNHQDKCMYEYCTCYIKSSGHFHGESAEQQHPELNIIGHQVKQMNHGHRHDKLNNFHNDWNWRKVMTIGKFKSLMLSR